MCIGGGGGGTDNSVLNYQQQQDTEARQKEADRQARIKLGRSQIDKLFDTGQTLKPGTGEGKKTIPNPAYVEAYTNATKTAAGPGTGGPATYTRTGLNARPDDPFYGTSDQQLDAPNVQGAGMAAVKDIPVNIEQDVPAEWQNGTGTAFNQDFYDKRKEAYLNNYLPQLGDQFKQARETMAYALARSGMTRSSVAADQYAQLDKKKQIEEGTLASQAEGDVNTLKGQVEDARTGLINDLNISADPGGAANLALARTQQIAGTPVSYSPLGDIFAGVASGIGNFVTGVRQAGITNIAGLNARVPNPTPRAGGSGGTSVVP
jgi:hypothetical protein